MIKNSSNAFDCTGTEHYCLGDLPENKPYLKFMQSVKLILASFILDEHLPKIQILKIQTFCSLCAFHEHIWFTLRENVL